jgi:hypothetical protein
MSTDNAADPRLAALPIALRELLNAELAAGNAIAEIGGSFPAPPVGAYVKLARAVTTRPRANGDGLVFYDRNSSAYSGEWTDAKRYFFLLEPSHPPKPEPDMDAIRDGLNAAANTPSPPASSKAGDGDDGSRFASRPSAADRWPSPVPIPAAFNSNSCLNRFQRSMVIDYEKWHDGIGYDLSILNEADPSELVTIEAMLIARRSSDWRDVEALATIGTERAKAELLRAFSVGNAEIRGAVLSHAPELVSESKKTDHLVEALRTGEFYYGLSQAINEAADFHPPEVIAQLFQSALKRDGGVAVHCAAVLMFIHGKAAEKFDWAHRPFFLRFKTEKPAEREAVFRELCDRIGVDPEIYL